MIGEGAQGGVPLRHEPALDDVETARCEGVQIAGADRLVLDESGTLEHFEVLADRRPAHRKGVGESTDWPRAVAQHFDDLTSSRVAEGIEGNVRLVTHGQPLLYSYGCLLATVGLAGAIEAEPPRP